MAEFYGRGVRPIAFNLAVFGVILYIADKVGPNRKENTSFLENKFDVLRSTIIGVSQAFAIFPGVSRSGITLTASRFLGIGRKESSEFSFFLAIPLIIIGSSMKTVEVLTKIKVGAYEYALGEVIYSWILGIIISFAVGLLTIHFFLRLVRKTDFIFFAVYRVLLSLALYYYLIR